MKDLDGFTLGSPPVRRDIAAQPPAERGDDRLLVSR
jgi:hypothetical protein